MGNKRFRNRNKTEQVQGTLLETLPKIKKEWIILFAIVLFAFILIFFRLTRHDILTDDGHYALRSLVYFDYLESKNQTTPVQWFGYRPWWSYLSFHDHPPLVFFIQYLFFSIFGASILVARLSPAIAGVSSVVAVYFIARLIGGRRAAYFAALLTAVNSYFLWTARVGLLESVFLFISLLGFLYFIKAIEREKYFFHAAIFLGLAFLSKYTILFSIPALLGYAIWKKRFGIFSKKILLAVLLFIVVISPVIVYNVQMFRTRGHFDVQFSDLFKQGNSDWPLLSERISATRLNPLGSVELIIGGYSWPYFIILLLSFAYFCFRRDFSRTPALFFVLLLISYLTLFVFVDSAPRWLGVTAPIAAIIMGSALAEFKYQKIALSIFLVLFSFSLVYAWNTNHAIAGGPAGFWRSNLRIANLGYNQLDKRIARLFEGTYPSAYGRGLMRRIIYKELRPEGLDFSLFQGNKKEFRSIVVFDLNLNWASTVWTFSRFRLYGQYPVFSSQEFFKILETKNIGVSLLQNIDGVYFVMPSIKVASSTAGIRPEMLYFIENFRTWKAAPPEKIYDGSGNEAFYLLFASSTAMLAQP